MQQPPLWRPPTPHVRAWQPLCFQAAGSSTLQASASKRVTQEREVLCSSACVGPYPHLQHMQSQGLLLPPVDSNTGSTTEGCLPVSAHTAAAGPHRARS